jgi:hypothetical protein
LAGFLTGVETEGIIRVTGQSRSIEGPKRKATVPWNTKPRFSIALDVWVKIFHPITFLRA